VEKGYAVIPGPFGPAHLRIALSALDKAVARAQPHDFHTSSTGTNVRMEGLLDRAPVLSALFTHVPLLQVASEKIGGPFRLSAFHLRTVLPGAPAQRLHQDVAPGEDGWPLIGFIFMVDKFCASNGATRFVPGTATLASMTEALRSVHPYEEHACGSRGEMIVFDGSVWHGYSANFSTKPRRAVYGALIPRHAKPARNYRTTLPPSIWDELPADCQKVLSGA
jgi:ectoine hydroxylase-related dioxygenase (phytanoyl-CoA dioxygenase family)